MCFVNDFSQSYDVKNQSNYLEIRLLDIYPIKYFSHYENDDKPCNFADMEIDLGNIKENIITLHPGFQEMFCASSVDVVFGGGAAGGGKSVALTLAYAEPFMTDPDFRMLISRRSLQNQKAGGGFVEKFKEYYGEYCSVKESDSPRVSFPNGSFCDLTYIDDSNMPKLRERAKGWEYDVIAIDELTEVTWEGFTYILTRNRGKSKTCTGQIRATMNPKRSCWIREFIDWYVGLDGFIIPERDGVVRYFYVNGTSVRDVVWGNSKEEVYRKCRIDIDRKLRILDNVVSYKDMIKSFVFYVGLIKENKSLLENNAGYVGSLAASGGKTSQGQLEGNWNVDPEEDEKAPITSEAARTVFTNDPQINLEKWVTVDLADYGKDNLVAFAWNGFHIVDMIILTRSTPRENAEKTRIFAQENDVAESHIIYDGTSGRYFNDYIPDAICYYSSKASFGMYFNQAPTVKDMCYLRLVKMINDGGITMDEKVSRQNYIHQEIHHSITVGVEFMEECSVVRFKELPNGSKKLLSKIEMNKKLGRNRSMDVLDPCAMRMYPCANIPYGEEMQQGFSDAENEEEYYNTTGSGNTVNVYDASVWC